MSVIIASGQQISNSPINTSKTKQMYSFTKSERFPPLRRDGYADIFYELPDIKTKRSTCLGKGSRSDFTSGRKGINTNFYDNATDFDPKKPHSPCYTFGVGRDKYAKVYYETNKMMDMNIPGPAKYNYLKSFGNDAPKFTMKGKNPEQASNYKSKSLAPGPGEYPVMIMINKAGKYPISSIRNVSSLNFGADKEKRFKYNFNTNPGPEQYEQKQLLGKIFDSRHRTSEGKTMYGRYKDVDSRIGNPGPGQYRAFSDFGIYESKYALTEPKRTETK